MNSTTCPESYIAAPCVFFGRPIGEVSSAADRAGLHPLLSIGIPTFNRAGRLRSLLHSLVHQCARVADEVEIIVSDNASTDDTATVVATYRQYFPITYSRNAVNEGACRNVQILGSALARGRFTWLLGDDDLVRPDGVGRVLAVLKQHSDVHFVFANTSPRSAEEYAAHSRDGLVRAEDFPENGPVKARLPGDRLLERFDELIDPAFDEVYLGSLMCGVFRTDTWREYQVEIQSRDSVFNGLETSYPHALVYAHTMVGRKAYYLSHPVSLAFWGAQEWIGRVPRLLLLRLPELLSLYEQYGVAHRRIAACRAALVRISRDSLRALLLDAALPGFDEFDLRKYISENRESAPAIFEQLDDILAESARRKLRNRQVEAAAELIRLYPSNKPAVPAPPPAPTPVPQTPAAVAPSPVDAAAFAARVAEIEAMLRAGRIDQATDALQQLRTTAPNADCVARVDELLGMLRDLPPAGNGAPAAPLEFFGAEELTNLQALLAGFEGERGNAELLAQVKALRDGLANYLGGAELTQLPALLAGDFGQVYFRVAGLDLGADPDVPRPDLATAVTAGFTTSGFDPRPILVHELFRSHARR